MAWPKKDDPNYQKFVDSYNERRRKRREDPEYMARSKERWKAQKERRAVGDRKQKERGDEG